MTDVVELIFPPGWTHLWWVGVIELAVMIASVVWAKRQMRGIK